MPDLPLDVRDAIEGESSRRLKSEDLPPIDGGDAHLPMPRRSESDLSVCDQRAVSGLMEMRSSVGSRGINGRDAVELLCTGCRPSLLGWRAHRGLNWGNSGTMNRDGIGVFWSSDRW